MFTSIRVASARPPLTVVGVFADQSTVPASPGLTAGDRRTLAAARRTPGFSADPGECTPAGPALLLVGLGERDAADAEQIRRVGTRLIRALDRIAPRSVRLGLEGSLGRLPVDPRTAGRCLAEGAALANWRVDFFDGAATKTPAAHPTLTITTGDAELRAGLREGLRDAACVNEARRVAATPPNICTPAWIEREARRLARKAGLTCRTIGFQEAKRLGMGGLVNVGMASDSKPRLVILEHRPTRPKRGVRLALVGKTMTYDTGGYSLKISNGMKGMKYDGNGGCAVLGAMLAIAARKLPIHVIGLLPTAENMVSGGAYRPDDIITMYNGVSVEVTNTDAEGRLILGDALAYACDKLKPTAILDVATLTGGVVVALGGWCAGLFCNDDGLRSRVETAAETTGERVWRLPLWDEHRAFMRSRHADIWNSGPKRDGHAIQGAAFLDYFVDADVPWAHIDIAGVSDVSRDQGPYVTGPTGYGVRLLAEVAAGYASADAP